MLKNPSWKLGGERNVILSDSPRTPDSTSADNDTTHVSVASAAPPDTDGSRKKPTGTGSGGTVSSGSHGTAPYPSQSRDGCPDISWRMHSLQDSMTASIDPVVSGETPFIWSNSDVAPACRRYPRATAS